MDLHDHLSVTFRATTRQSLLVDVKMVLALASFHRVVGESDHPTLHQGLGSGLVEMRKA